MKRSILLILVVTLGVTGYFSLRWDSPFTIVNGSTLESILDVLFQGDITTILLIIAVVLFAFLLYSREIRSGLSRLFRPTLSFSSDKNYDTGQSLSRRFQFTEKALHDFAGAMQEYAEHLESHTSAIQGLSEASQALMGSAAEQNRILEHLSESVIRDRTNREVSMMERILSEFEKKKTMALRAREAIESGASEFIVDEIHAKKETESPPGCVVNPKALDNRPYFKRSW